MAMCLIITLAACGDDNSNSIIPEPDPDPKPELTDEQWVEQQLEQMTLREKVGQLFFTRPEDITNVSTVTEFSTTMRTTCEQYPVGGIILYAKNIQNPTQLTNLSRMLKTLPHTPLLCIDEEGGSVTRIALNKNFDVPKFPSMGTIGASGDVTSAYNAGRSIGTYLNEYGLDIDFAPVADVNTNPDNIVIGARAFSNDPAVAAPMVTNFLKGLQSAGVVGCLKHFPGHGDTKNDTHYGYAETKKTWAEMLNCEMITFKAGINDGALMIMTAHIATPNVTGNNNPATMSSLILQEKLRNELGFKGIIITDAMSMGAITNQYSTQDATIGTILAGADIVLNPQDLRVAFEAVVKAVENGTITQERINASVRRILLLKRARTKAHFAAFA